MVVVKNIILGSLAEKLGIRAGDCLLTINNHQVVDILGLRFWEADSNLYIIVRRGGKILDFHCSKDPDQDLGITLTPMKVKRCRNQCVFCYVDQLPKGLRAPLYVKDEDYRLSFLHGNYVTLTNVKPSELDRIIAERLSPLYVSVHATNPDVRQRLLGSRAPDNILKTMGHLCDAGIQLHAQIVICPGWNDGEVLHQTLEDLSRLVPGVQSISLVPVGLTCHREGLPHLRPLTVSEAHDIMEFAKHWQQRFLERVGMRVIYPSDELFLMTNTRIPGTSYYEDFPQVENGVGLIRKFINDLSNQWRHISRHIPDTRLTLITGTLAAPILKEKVVPKLMKIKGLSVSVVEVENNLLGDSVTVAGLLSGQDILRKLKQEEIGDAVVLSPDVLNAEQLFLDDLSLSNFRKKVGVPVFVYQRNFPEILEKIEKIRNSR
jgi:putative radical SAM enzyme (TIGR03279 family)